MGCLLGKKIAITRPRGQEESFVKLLDQEGALILSCPLIKISPCFSTEPLSEILSRVSEHDWVCFTSANGVNLVMNFAQQEKKLSCFQKARLACIGPATEKALHSWGMRAQLVPEIYQAEGLLSVFRKDQIKDKSFLLLRAKGARKILQEVLLQEGGKVVDVPIYETVPDRDGMERLRLAICSNEVDCITFTSSSTVTSFVALLQESKIRLESGKIVFASIGPVTSKTLSSEGLWVDVEASVSTTKGLVEALKNFFERTAAEKLI